MLFDQSHHELTTPDLPNMTRLVAFERHLSAARWQFIRGLLLGILVSSAVAMLVFRHSNIPRDKASLQNTSGQTATGNSDAQAPSRTEKSAPDVAGTSFFPPPVTRPHPSKLSNAVPEKPVESLPAKQPPNSPASSLGSLPAPLQAPYTSGAQPAKKSLVITPEQLWSSVQAGDTKAAVALADLYLRGDGVPVNCDQARILLDVASKAKNAEAIQKLQDLDQTGCPAP